MVDDRTKWGDRTMMHKIRELEQKNAEQDAELQEAQEHVQTVADVKTFLKVGKWLIAILTTLAAGAAALKTFGVI